MGVLNYAQARIAYAPACEATNRPGAQEAWDAHQAWMKHFGYELRAADTGSRNCRNATGSNLKSMHAFFIKCTILLWNLGKRIAGGLAADFNWQTNPYGPRLITDMPREMVDAILAIRTNNGVRVFMWGGYWSGNKDAMHYDIVCAPADLATGIDPRTLPKASQPNPEPPAPPPDPDEEDDMRPRTINETVPPKVVYPINLPPWERADYGFKRCVVSLSSDQGKHDPENPPGPMLARVVCLNANGVVLAVREDVTNFDLEKNRGHNQPPSIDAPVGTRQISIQNQGKVAIGVCVELFPA